MAAKVTINDKINGIEVNVNLYPDSGKIFLCVRPDDVTQLTYSGGHPSFTTAVHKYLGVTLDNVREECLIEALLNGFLRSRNDLPKL